MSEHGPTKSLLSELSDELCELVVKDDDIITHGVIVLKLHNTSYDGAYLRTIPLGITDDFDLLGLLRGAQISAETDMASRCESVAIDPDIEEDE